MAISPSLLLETDMPMPIIGQPLGYRETSAFSSAFRARTRRNPAGSHSLIAAAHAAFALSRKPTLRMQGK
jgi:transcriptional regulator GlxA family with amidase domain